MGGPAFSAIAQLSSAAVAGFLAYKGFANGWIAALFAFIVLFIWNAVETAALASQAKTIEVGNKLLAELKSHGSPKG